MKIGLITACYTPVVNGVVRMVSLHQRYLEEAGHEVVVFTLGDSNEEVEQGVIRSPAVPLGKSGYYFSTRYSPYAKSMVREMDILHCHHPLMGLELAHRYGQCPIVFTNHTRYDLYLSVYSPLPETLSEMLMRQLWPSMADYTDVVIAPSKGVRDLLLEVGVRTPVELIYNGIELQPFREILADRADKVFSSEEPVRAIYVGRLALEKDVSGLLEEFSKARHVDNRLELILVGDGPSRGVLEQKAVSLGVGSSVEFVGETAYESVPGYLAKADFFVTKSVSEVHPLSVIEAMAAGLPVVAVKSPGISDIVSHGESGLLSGSEVGELAQNLLTLTKDSELRRTMSQAASEASRLFSIESTISKTMDIYQRLAEERPDIARRKKLWQVATLEQLQALQATSLEHLQTLQAASREQLHSWQEFLPQVIRTKGQRDKSGES